MMLAARGLGIGTCLTTIAGIFKSDEVFEILGVPTDKGWVNHAAVSAGYPLGRWGTAKRRPVNEVVFSERWGAGPNWTVDEPLWVEPENYGRTEERHMRYRQLGKWGMRGIRDRARRVGHLRGDRPRQRGDR